MKQMFDRLNSGPMANARLFRNGLRLLALVPAIALAAAGAGGPNSKWALGPTNFAAPARVQYTEAQSRFQIDTNNPEAAWRFGRACFDLAEFSLNDDTRADLANIGIGVCRNLVSQKPELAQAHYFFAMNLGQLARTKTLGALPLVDQMEGEFEKALELDEHLEHAGPDRNLGLLYLEAPSIGSIGSRRKARQHLRRAVELEPNFPENRLNLLEAYSRWGDRNGAARELKALEDLWPGAKNEFSGEKWAPAWVDWERRFSTLKEKVGETKMESPRATQ